MDELDRRTVLRGAGAAGALAATAPLLAACGAATAEGDGGSGGADGGGGVTVATGDIPVEGGVISGQVVVTQPETGTYKAFSAICTHQSCTVSSIESNVIHCACHNSQFSASDGSVIQGPATSALPAKAVTVSGDSVVVA
jgi:Rieske Fe-S protein